MSTLLYVILLYISFKGSQMNRAGVSCGSRFLLRFGSGLFLFYLLRWTGIIHVTEMNQQYSEDMLELIQGDGITIQPLDQHRIVIRKRRMSFHM